MYNKALQIAYDAHDGQLRKNSRLPYIVHPIRVANCFENNMMKTIAVLHDVVEDTHITLEDLYSQFDNSVIDAIDSLTKREGETYFEYLDRLKENEIAVEIKIADIIDNLSDSPSESMIERYDKSLKILTQ